MCCCTANKENVHEERLYLFSTNIREHSIKILVQPYNMKCVKKAPPHVKKKTSTKFPFLMQSLLKCTQEYLKTNTCFDTYCTLLASASMKFTTPQISNIPYTFSFFT